jgi:hypothetical protein
MEGAGIYPRLFIPATRLLLPRGKKSEEIGIKGNARMVREGKGQRGLNLEQ